MRIFVGFLIAIMIASGSLPALAVQTASIGYVFTARPSGLPADFTPAPNARLRFLTATAIDGNPIASALWEPAGKSPATTTMIVAVHGSGDNYYGDPLGFLGRGLSAAGYAYLAIDTRQHDDKINTDNFYDIRRDIEAAVFTARSLGYKTIVLLGHSLGTAHVQFYAAQDWSPDIKGVILLSAFGNLPWKSRNILIANEKQYAELTENALASVRNGTSGAALPTKMGYLQGASSPVSGQHFLTYRDETTAGADSTFWIKRIPHPILLVRDQSDGIVLSFEPHQLLSAAGTPGSLVTSISFVLLPDDKPPGINGHRFRDNLQPLLNTVRSWLTAQHL